MIEKEKAVQIVMFSGGRGTTALANAFKKHSQINIVIVVNAYDDGLSTGRIRQFIPGMLGPSDVRKNVSALIEDSDASRVALKIFVEYRLAKDISYDKAMSIMDNIILFRPLIESMELDKIYKKVSLGVANNIAECITAFTQYCKEQSALGNQFDFSDCAIGNILLGGCFLLAEGDFNCAVEKFAILCGVTHRVLNITDGENLVLLGLKSDGEILFDEAQLVSPQNNSLIKDVYLLKQYLSESEIVDIEDYSTEEKHRYLLTKDVRPCLNPQAKGYIARADIIIYGPGTQHSSLLPSYLTEGVAQAIAENSTAQKIFVSNLYKDVEIKGETANSLAMKLHYYMNFRNTESFPREKLVTKYFFQTPRILEGRSKDYVNIDVNSFPFSEENVISTNWESNEGAHIGGRVLDEIISLSNIKLQKSEYYHYMVTIIVPCLNESPTLKTVLNDLVLLDFSELKLAKEIIYVDGGSSDGSIDIAKSFENVRVLEERKRKGRGAAIRMGMDYAAGNIVVVFPSDDEYEVKDIPKLVNTIVRDGASAAFGSRVSKCVDIEDIIFSIYRGNRVLYLLSKYGGYLISFVSLLLFNRYVIDALTGMKAFDAEALKDLKLSSNGVELETEIVAELAKRKMFFMEIPVDYRPRTKAEGKKVTAFDGVKAVIKLVQCKMSKQNKQRTKEENKRK